MLATAPFNMRNQNPESHQYTQTHGNFRSLCAPEDRAILFLGERPASVGVGLQPL